MKSAKLLACAAALTLAFSAGAASATSGGTSATSSKANSSASAGSKSSANSGASSSSSATKTSSVPIFSSSAGLGNDSNANGNSGLWSLTSILNLISNARSSATVSTPAAPVTVGSDPISTVITTGSTVASGITSAVPEPSTYAMLVSGLALLGLAARRRASGRRDDNL